MIEKIFINNFRIFRNKEIKLGKYLTVIAGKNSTGKSTLLAMLGNSCELKKYKGVTIIKKRFKSQFSEILKGDPKFDKSGSKKYTIFKRDNGDGNYRDFRITWQDNKTRFRVIPYYKSEERKKRDAKFEYPVIYLGLSRLYPIGESKDEGLKKVDLSLTEEEAQWFLTQYNKILFLNDKINEVVSLKIGETDRKQGLVVSTDRYSYLCNSAGQDNIGQILIAILSFIRLSKSNKYDYKGGLLLIDEIETTLHPSAQRRLINLLIECAREYSIQTVFTTHSESIIKTIANRVFYNKEEINNNIELYYLRSKDTSPDLNIYRNPEIDFIIHDLNAYKPKESIMKIKIYSEDEEARWLINNILEPYLDYIEFLNIKLGHDELLNLFNADIEYFSDTILILDGDVAEDKLKKLHHFVRDNVLKLPGTKRPEQEIFECIKEIQDENFWDEAFSRFRVSKEAFLEHSPENYKKTERENYKIWFQDNLFWIEKLNVFNRYFLQRYNNGIREFRKKFINIYNKIAKKYFSMPIKEETFAQN